jgi:putative serine protease PepD
VPAVLSERSQIGVGEPVALISAPPGQDPSRVPGEVAVNDQVMPELGLALIGISLEAETDVAGAGPVIDDAGEVVGLLGFASVGADGAQTALAVPATVVARIADQLITTGEVVHPFLGVSVEDAPGGGAVVSGVAADGPAAQADLRVDDVITAIDGRAVTVAADIVLEVQTRVVGDEVTVTYLRDGVEARTTATLAAASAT